jgi:uncharacterized Fe-S cluster protein YjdI
VVEEARDMSDPTRSATRAYENGRIRVIWCPELCAHSGVCVRGRPALFRPRDRPWLDVRGAESERIAARVDQWPQGALSWERM